MKLLSKSEIDKAKAQDRQREVNEGMKLAKSVDSLRETHAHEEAVLTKFRENTLKEAMDDISKAEAEKRILDEEVKNLRQEREILLNPVDLTEAREKVGMDRVEVDRQKQENSEKEISLVSRETQVRSSLKEIEDEKSRIANHDEVALKYLSDSEEKFKESEKVKKETEEWKKQVEKELKKAEAGLKLREINLKAREQELIVEKEQADLKSKELQVQEIRLQDQRETLERALNRIK